VFIEFIDWLSFREADQKVNFLSDSQCLRAFVAKKTLIISRIQIFATKTQRHKELFSQPQRNLTFILLEI